MANNGIIYNVVKRLNDIFYMQQSYCFSNQTKSYYWDIKHLFSPGQKKSVEMKYAVLILNRPITMNQDFMKTFWNNATVRVTIDGGTVQWDKYISKLSQEMQQSIKLPTFITGDFDSITTEILEKYNKKGCKTVHTPDQMYTDFTKALMELKAYCKDKEIEMDYVIALGQSSGRLDQILGNIQTLFINKEQNLLHPNTKLFMITDDALSWLLRPGDHVITVPEDTRTHKRAWCSLIPVGETCESVTSSGLQWNLDNQPLRFGELVSTSNAFSGADRVTIRCSHTLLWSMRIPSLTNPV